MMAGETQTKTMNMIEAINSAMDIMLERDPNTVVMGEDVGFFGGDSDDDMGGGGLVNICDYN